MLLAPRKSKQGDVAIGKGGWFVMLEGEKLEDTNIFQNFWIMVKILSE
jgi:hypothetical protein